MKGKKTGGRAKGTPNKVTAQLKDAILAAAENVGSDRQGKGGLTGYLEFLARDEPKTFGALLGRVLPLQLTGADDGPISYRIEREIVRPETAHPDGGSL